MDALSDYRTAVKKIAGSGDINKKDLFVLSDKLRDDVLPKTGVLLKDNGDDPSTWNYVDPEELAREMAQAEEAKKATKGKALTGKALKDSTPPSEFFKVFNDKNYTQFDDNGVPTHNIREVKKGADKGKKLELELSEQERKSLMKAYEKQQKNHEKWLST